MSKKEIQSIVDSVKPISKWDGIKHGGKYIISNGDSAIAYNKIEEEVRNHHIYIVPFGELERFVKEVSGHGPEWVNDVLEKYPDIGNDVYKSVREFIESIDL